MSEADDTPRPPSYRTIAGFQVGPAAIELADRTDFTREDGVPKARVSRVLSLALERDITSSAEALALAAAITALAAKLDAAPDLVPAANA